MTAQEFRAAHADARHRRWERYPKRRPAIATCIVDLGHSYFGYCKVCKIRKALKRG